MPPLRLLALLLTAGFVLFGTQLPLAEVLRRGGDLEKKGDLGGAERLYNEALSRFPRSAELALRLGGLSLRRTDWTQASAHLEKAAALNPRDSEPLYYLSQAYYFAGRQSDALRTVLKAAALAPRNSSVLQKAGQYLCDNARCPEGLEYLQRARKIEPALEGIDFDLGMAWYKLTKTAEALPYLESAVKRNPANATAWLYLGEVLVYETEWQRARDAFLAALKQQPRNQHALYGLGRALAGLERHQDAISAFRQAIEADPGLAEARFQLGRALIATGRAEEGQRELELFRRVRDSLRTPQPLIDAGQSESEKQARATLEKYISENREPDALEYLRKSAPAVNGHYVAGAIYYNMKRYTDAIRVLEKASLAKPPSADAVAYLGWAYLAAGREGAAKAALERALSLDPRNQLAKIGFGKLHFARKEWAEAIRYFEESETNQVPVLLQLCYAYFRQGRRDKAMETAEVARIFGADDPASLQAIAELTRRESAPALE